MPVIKNTLKCVIAGIKVTLPNPSPPNTKNILSYRTKIISLKYLVVPPVSQAFVDQFHTLIPVKNSVTWVDNERTQIR